MFASGYRNRPAPALAPPAKADLLNGLYFWWSLAHFTSLSLVGIPYDSSLPGWQLRLQSASLSACEKIFSARQVCSSGRQWLLHRCFGHCWTFGNRNDGCRWHRTGNHLVDVISLRRKDCPVDQSLTCGSSLRITFTEPPVSDRVCFQSDNSLVMPCCANKPTYSSGR